MNAHRRRIGQGLLALPGAVWARAIGGPALLALPALLPLVVHAGLAPAAHAAPTESPPSPWPDLERWGSGRYTRFGLRIYDAELWAVAPPQPPLALRLTYHRSLAGRDIARASVDEMRRVGAPESDLPRWGERMAALFPDVREGDRITGLHHGDGARFEFNGRELGRIDEPAFARHFFGIWLDPRTSAPALRAQLLRRPDPSGSR